MYDALCDAVGSVTGKDVIERLRAESEALRGEARVLRALLSDCVAVIRTIEADDSDETERLLDLLGRIDRALEVVA